MVTYVYKCSKCNAVCKFSVCCKKKCPKCGEKKLVELGSEPGD